MDYKIGKQNRDKYGNEAYNLIQDLSISEAWMSEMLYWVSTNTIKLIQFINYKLFQRC